MPGPWPATCAISPYKVRAGARPHPRPRRRAGRRDPRSSASATRPSWWASCSTRPSPTPSTTTTWCAERAVRLGLLRRRGPHAQALAAPGPGPGHPHPQAHLPHHRDREPPARRRARSERRGRPAPRRRPAPPPPDRGPEAAAERTARGAGAGADAGTPEEVEGAEPARRRGRRPTRRAGARRGRARPRPPTAETVARRRAPRRRGRGRRPRPTTKHGDRRAAGATSRRATDEDEERSRWARRSTPTGSAWASPPTGSRGGSATASTRDYLIEDWKIRDYLMKQLPHAAISRIEVERTRDRLRIDVHTARPGIVIGRRGAEADRLRADLAKMTRQPQDPAQHPGDQAARARRRPHRPGRRPTSSPAG